MEKFNVVEYWQKVDDTIDKFPGANIAYYDSVEYNDVSDKVERGSKQIVYVKSDALAHQMEELLLRIPSRRTLKIKIVHIGSDEVVLSKTRAAHARRLNAQNVIDMISRQMEQAKGLGLAGKRIFNELKRSKADMKNFAEKNGNDARCIIRTKCGYAYRVQYFDATEEKRKQVNLGDVLIVVLAEDIDGVRVVTAPRRAVRSDKIALMDDVIITRIDKYTGIYDADAVDNQAHK